MPRRSSEVSSRGAHVPSCFAKGEQLRIVHFLEACAEIAEATDKSATPGLTFRPGAPDLPPLPYAFASSPLHTFRAESSIAAARHVTCRAKLTPVKDWRSTGIEPAALEGGEMAATETLAPVWLSAVRYAAARIKCCEPTGELSLQLHSHAAIFAFDAEKQRKQDLRVPRV